MMNLHRSCHVAAWALVVALLATPSSAQVTLQLIRTLDGFSLSTGNPASVAAYGDTLYVGTLVPGPQITQIDDPLGTPVNAGTLAGSLTAQGNGYVSLDTDGTTLVAATNNSASNDVVQVFDVGTASLRYESLASGLPGPNTSRIDGAAIDPLTGNVWVTAFGAGLPTVLDPNTLTDVSDDPSTMFAGSPTGTGWRDLNFSPDGDLYLRGTNGVLGGVRNGTTVDDFTTIDSLGATAGFSQIVGGGSINLQDSFQSAINIELLPASFTGTEDLIIANTRAGQPTLTPFGDQVLAFEADAGFVDTDPFSLNQVGVPATIDFLAADGVSTFSTPGSENGIYDFSFDPVNEVLYISDIDNGVIYLFGQVPEASGVDGDYNNNGIVDAADYTLWRDNLGQPVDLPNDTTPGTVDNGDYATWANNFGSSASAVAVPEPAAALLVLVGAMAGLTRRA